jgi:PAS domain S-box-containing protein
VNRAVNAAMNSAALDYRSAFELAPVGLVMSRQRLMIDCNQELLVMFGARREQIVGKSFEILYPSADEYERMGLRIAAQLDSAGRYADERVMKRLTSTTADGQGQLFWCHVRATPMPQAFGSLKTCRRSVC